MRARTKPHRIITVVLLAGLLAAMAVWQARAHRARQHGDGRLSAPLQRGRIVESVYGIGTVTANKRYELKPGATMTVRNLYIREGDTVTQGQQLVELERGVVFSAPIDGTVVSLPIKVGENVFPQTVVLEVVDLLDRYVVVALEQRAAIRVRRGQTAKLSFEELRDTAFDGTVESVYSHENEFLVRITVPKLPPEILPGMTADVAIGVGEPREALLIPVAALADGRVQVQRGAGRAAVAVTTGLVDGAMAEVVSGDLRPGDRLVLPAPGAR